jgi:hypothetical protein
MRLEAGYLTSMTISMTAINSTSQFSYAGYYFLKYLPFENKPFENEQQTPSQLHLLHLLFA